MGRIPVERHALKPMHPSHTHSRFRLAVLTAFLISAFFAPQAKATIDFTNWASSSGGTATGSVNGVNFTVSGLGASSLDSANLTGSNFTGFTGSASQGTIDMESSDQLTITLDSTVGTLYFYTVFWRGNAGGAQLADPAYTFSAPFTVLAGETAGSVAGDTLTVPSGFASGVLAFSNIQTLTISTNNVSGNIQELTFGLSDAPEPTTATLMGIGVAVLAAFRFRKSTARR